MLSDSNFYLDNTLYGYEEDAEAFGKIIEDFYGKIGNINDELYFRGVNLLKFNNHSKDKIIKYFMDYAKPVYKQTCDTSGDNLTQASLKTSVHKIFLPSLVEIVGTE